MKRFCATVVLVLHSAFAEVPQLINYQGRLLDGTNLVNGSVGISLRLFKVPSGGASIYEDSNSVTVVDGLYATFIGDDTVSGSMGSALTNAQVWIEVAVNGAALAPRERLGAVAYAVHAWGLNGNAGTPGNSFLGTTDDQPVELRVNGTRALRIEPNTNGAPNLIGGAPVNFVAPGVHGATIGGGGATNTFFFGPAGTNSVAANFGTVGGGYVNGIGEGAEYATIAGGRFNRAGVSAIFASIGGGDNNAIQDSAYRSTIAGGSDNVIQTNGSFSVIGGGELNSVQDGAAWSMIGGGQLNRIGSSHTGASIGGGKWNSIGGFGSHATIAGGLSNRAGGVCAVVPGGEGNVADGSWSMAAGHRAKANHQGSFVWADSQQADLASTANDQFLIRAAGGVGIGSDAVTPMPEAALTVKGSIGFIDGTVPLLYLNQIGNTASGRMVVAHSANYPGWGLHYDDNIDAFLFQQDSGVNPALCVNLANGRVGIGIANPTNKLHVTGIVQATGYITSSDRNAKENVAPVSADEILSKVSAMPIATWNFKDDSSGTHLGPMAQDFRRAFGLGNSDSGIFTVDADGVALAAIQALAKQNAELRAEMEQLKARLDMLEAH